MFDSPQAFGEALEAFLNSNQIVHSILMENILNGEMADFLVGGCRICAEGMRAWMHACPATLSRWGVMAPPTSPCTPILQTRRVAIVSKWYHPKHVVVEAEGLYLDAAGIHTQVALLERWARWGPRITACSSQRLTRYRIVADKGASDELALSLAREFGAFQVEWLRSE
jgi:hypothetical protein